MIKNASASGLLKRIFFPKEGLITVLAAMALFGATSLTHAADASCQVWLVSTRGMPHCGVPDPTLEGISYWRWDEECRWSSADAEQFQAADDASVPTVVYIHGNRTDADYAVIGGWYVYRFIKAAAGDRAVRFVIWSWPSDRAIRPCRADARLKADYSDVESHYLARWLDRLKPDVPVSLVGHSFGPRVITGALHLLAGGQVAGESLPASTATAWSGGKRNPVRAVLLAAAVDADALATGGSNGLALSLVEEMLVTCNPCDWILRRYPRLEGCGPQAMGAVGPCLNDGAEKVEVVDTSGAVGRIHDLRRYCAALNVCRQWAHYTFLDGPPPQKGP